MRIPRAVTVLAAAVTLAALLGVGYLVSRPYGPVLREAGLSLTTISPNADGVDDVTEIAYRLRRRASVSIYFEGEDGQRHYFRQEEPRARGEFQVLFGGVVDGYAIEGEQVAGDVQARLLPDGDYRWAVEAIDALSGRRDVLDGTLTIRGGDSELPDPQEFSITPSVFTPNQDGLDDLVWINVYIPKDADLSVYLIDDEGTRYFIPETQRDRMPGEAGRHLFQWDGGVDDGREPPPDGVYQVMLEAEDAEGQRVTREGEVEIAFSGVPMAEIISQPVGDTVSFSSEAVIIGDVLTFQLTVENYGDAPIRTTGPEPGHIYEQDENFASTGYYQESGAWRVGLHCDTCQTDYPWRWALGTPETLTAIETDGQTHYYLMPGERAVIRGGVRLTNIVESRNPQEFWAGLIHEDVEISEVNNRVDPHWIEIVPQAETASTDG